MQQEQFNMITEEFFQALNDIQQKEETLTRWLHRAEATDTSVASARELPTTELESLVLAAIRHSGEKGVTQDELLMLFPGYSYSSITARPAALKRKKLIYDSGERRKGRSGRSQAVLKAVQ